MYSSSLYKRPQNRQLALPKLNYRSDNNLLPEHFNVKSDTKEFENQMHDPIFYQILHLCITDITNHLNEFKFKIAKQATIL